MEILGAIGIWLLIGVVADYSIGVITDYILKKELKIEDDDELEKMINIKHFQEFGYVGDEMSGFEYFQDILFWPMTVYYAIQGTQKIIQEEKKKG